VKDSQEPYAQIMDESMMIGSQKLMASLDVKAQKSGDKVLRFEDINISDISVRSSWAAAAADEVIKRVSSKQGSPPKYIISDNVGRLTKAVRDQSMAHMPDVGHAMVLFVDRVYKKIPDSSLFAGILPELSFGKSCVRQHICGLPNSAVLHGS
jgi:hypothetical protein